MPSGRRARPPGSRNCAEAARPYQPRSVRRASLRGLTGTAAYTRRESVNTTDPMIGRLVDGRYQVRSRIARGGMATVYVATDLRLERRVALKVMHGHLSDDEVFKDRFIQEARSAARLAHPNVVNVFDQGQDG